MKQLTIKNPVESSGIGIHSGEISKITFKPAPTDTGIVFIREDLPGVPRTKALTDNIVSTSRGTNLKNINTVEHVLSAAYALGIDNMEIYLNNVEPPVFDGSAVEYLKLIKSAQIIEQEAEKQIFNIEKHIVIEDGEKFLSVLPSKGFRILATIDYPGTAVGLQAAAYSREINSYERDIAPARTFGFLEEVAKLRSMGLALGGSLENAVVIDGNKYLTELRFDNEPARHKILDLIGDLSLIGRQINGNIISIKAGHSMNVELARRIQRLWM